MGLEASAAVELQRKLSVPLPRKLSRSCVHFHGLPCGSTYINVRPLRPLNFDVLALLPLASMRFHVLPENYHDILLSSMTKEKQIEACTEGN